VPVAQRIEDPVRIDVRQHLQPDTVLRSEHELERRQLWLGQHAMQSAALDSVCLALRFLRGSIDDPRALMGMRSASTWLACGLLLLLWSSPPARAQSPPAPLQQAA